MHLTFINENDFGLVESWKQNKDGSVQWVYQDSSGVIREGFTRTIQVQTGTEEVEVGMTEPEFNDEGEVVLEAEPIYEERPVFEDEVVDVWAKLQAKIQSGDITLEGKSPEEIEAERLDAKNRVDIAAGNARLKYAAHGWGVESEYRLAAAEVAEWRTNGSDVNNVPDSLGTWVNASGMTVEEAAVDIETQAAFFNTLLNTIRNLRLTGKAAVQNSLPEDIESTTQSYIGSLNSV